MKYKIKRLVFDRRNIDFSMLGWGEGGRLSVQGGNGCCTGKSTVKDTGTGTGTGGKEKYLEKWLLKIDR